MSLSMYDLLPVLANKMAEASIDAQKMRIQESDSEFCFVHIEDKEYINPKYLSFEDQLKIIYFAEFLRENPNITNRMLKEIFAMSGRFDILSDVCKLIPNIINECKIHTDEKYFPYLYFGLKQSNKENNVGI